MGVNGEQSAALSGAQKLDAAYHWSRLDVQPADIKIFRGRKDGSGAALKLNLRVTFEVAEPGGYVRNQEGGLFLDLVPQNPGVDANGNFTFNWDSPQKVTAKLGKADILGLLAGIARWRAGHPVPTYLQPKTAPAGLDPASQVSLFHKFGKGTTAITYTFKDESAVLGVSKSKELRRQIALALTDELEIVDYLTLALRAYNKTGMR